MFREELKKRLGTNFYNVGLYTNGGILLNPAKLVRSMIIALPNNVQLFENSFMNDWEVKKDYISCYFQNIEIKTKKIIFAVNGFLKSLRLKKLIISPLL